LAAAVGAERAVGGRVDEAVMRVTASTNQGPVAATAMVKAEVEATEMAAWMVMVETGRRGGTAQTRCH
jgi:hypothetical protein